MSSATLEIGGRTFRTGDRVTTPDGPGTVIGLDPFADQEIGVRLDIAGGLRWFAFQSVQTPPLTTDESDPGLRVAPL